MKIKERCLFPVLIVLCIGVFPMSCGCARKEAYRFERAESREVTGSSVPAGELSDGIPAGEAPEGAVLTEEGAEKPSGPETIWVYVCGAVCAPGVYELPAGARVYQALEAAGGALASAELRSLNQAAYLADGEQITVFTKEEAAGAGNVPLPGAGAESAEAGKINLNTAGREELMTLPGIGEARAQAILSYREEHGPFTSAEEIMNIEGIKEKAFSKIKDKIEV